MVFGPRKLILSQSDSDLFSIEILCMSVELIFGWDSNLYNLWLAALRGAKVGQGTNGRAQGSQRGFGAFVDLTALVGVFYKYIFLVAYGYDSRWFFPIILFLLGLILELVLVH
jgi:hypothetical protein